MLIVMLSAMRIIGTGHRHTFQKFTKKIGRISLSQNSENILTPNWSITELFHFYIISFSFTYLFLYFLVWVITSPHLNYGHHSYGLLLFVLLNF